MQALTDGCLGKSSSVDAVYTSKKVLLHSLFHSGNWYKLYLDVSLLGVDRNTLSSVDKA